MSKIIHKTSYIENRGDNKGVERTLFSEQDLDKAIISFYNEEGELIFSSDYKTSSLMQAMLRLMYGNNNHCEVIEVSEIPKSTFDK